MTVRRFTVLEVRLGEDGATSVHGLGRDEVVGGDVMATVDLQLETAGGTLLSLEGLASLAPLVGLPTGSGFRRRLADLPRDTPEQRLARRLLDDLPIISQVAFQTTILDHPALARPLEVMDLRGADQCEGWRSDGTMLTQIADAGGILQMPLTTPVRDPGGPWDLDEHTVLPAMATRRRRRVEVAEIDGGLDVQAHFRDSFADPDGVERGLHGYTVTARVQADGTIETLDAAGVVLPWPECWRATGSTERVVGLNLRDIDGLAKTGLVGRGTCTHLNDTLRALVDVAELSGLAPVG
jgi:hypothetical protein